MEIEDFVILRRDLHAHPELRFQEFRTADCVASHLEAWGFEVDVGLAGTGVVGTLRGKGPNSILLRADMDALQLQELNDFPHVSRNPGVMHACGHDGHVTMLLAAAHRLSQRKRLPGTIHVVFQPGEEGGAGAQRMIDVGLLERCKAGAAFALHAWPQLPVGTIASRPGPIMAAGVRFIVTVNGRGAHAAQPQLGTDPITTAALMIQQFQLLVSRETDPNVALVLSVCMFQAGETDNIIPNQAVLRGTIRALGSQAIANTMERMQQMAHLLARANGAEAQVTFHQHYPVTANNADAVTVAFEAARSATHKPPLAVVESPPNMTSEDFGFILERMKGAYVLIGNAGASNRCSAMPLHSPNFDFNDDLIPIGARYWEAIVDRYFESEMAA
ncbi:MAG: amidohydrolase [Rhizobiales bacterium]|nr:amidohydrolase [Hyphomicrobiales bacterium]